MKLSTQHSALSTALAILFCASAAAAPRAQNGAECQILADVAVTARAMAVAEIPEAQAHVAAAHLWDTKSARAAELIRLVIVTAYRSRNTVADYGYHVGLTCIQTQGDLDSILGKGI